MSATELPPITRRGSHPSSKGSSPVSVAGKGVSVIKTHEKTPMISLDVESPIGSPRIKNRNLSVGSTTSSNVTSKSRSSQGVGFLKKSERTKTWCPGSTTEQMAAASQDGGDSSQKLETLFERQTSVTVSKKKDAGPGKQRKVSKVRSEFLEKASQLSKIAPSTLSSLGNRRSVSTMDLSNTKKDINNNSKSSKRSKLQRYNSEQKLTDFNRKNSNSTVVKKHFQRGQSIGYASGDRDTLSRSRRTSKRTDGTEDSAPLHGCSEDTGYDSDADVQERIIQWLIEVESCGEIPPETEIVEAGPQQTDTAIHVVYEK